MSLSANMRGIVAQSMIREAKASAQLRTLSLVLHGKQGFFNPSTLDHRDQNARTGNPNGLRVADAQGAIVFNHGSDF